jgi:SAM-dependent methyltransferase
MLRPRLLRDAVRVPRTVTGNSSRGYLREFLGRAAESVKPGDLVLDAGAGRAQYRGLFAHARYETADFLAVPGKAYRSPEYVCDLSAIPVEDARFDHVVCTQVLEHLPDPAAVLAEFHRVLKPGGRLWLTAPLFYAEHERPYDFYRYTQYGLRHLLEGAGFTVDELGWLEGYLGTLSYQARVMSTALPIDPAAWGGGLRGRGRALVARAARRLGGHAAGRLAELDRRHKFERRGLPKNYRVVATRRAGTEPTGRRSD